jgi:endonuclease/exonuclease/phosphatase family metal-dependent hydrolase
MRRLFPCVAAALLVAACNTSDSAGPSSVPATNLAADGSWEAAVAGAGAGAMPIRVYQQNVYPGFNIDEVVAGLVETMMTQNPAPFYGALYTGMVTLDATDWSERAARMAQEIEAQNPDVVSLNELVTVRRVGLGQLYGPTVPDETVDFLAVFTAELAKRGLPYRLVDSLPLTYAAIPVSDIFGLPSPAYATYYDRDALFVRQNVGVANVVVDTFAVELNEVVPQKRGFIRADLTLRGKTWRFVATHPEPSWPAASGQPTQVQEILAAAGGTTLPVVIAGDLNLEPTSPWYAQLTGAGFLDLLQVQYGSTAAGNTCCQSDPALRNPTPTLVKRIDYVMARPADGYKLGPMAIEVFGDEAAGMWTSDHAGLVAKLVMQKLQP